MSLEIERRSSGSNEKKQPAVPSIVSPPDSTRTAPSTTDTSAPSFTWWSPSACPGSRTISTARAPGSERKTTGDALPRGVEISLRFQLCTARILFKALVRLERP